MKLIIGVNFLEPTLIKILEMLESFGLMSAICIFFAGLIVSVHFHSARVAIFAVSVSTAICLAPLFIKLFFGIDLPTEPVQVNSEQVAVVQPIPVDEYAIEDGNHGHAEEGIISIKALVIVGAIPFAIGLLFVIVHSPGLSSVFERTNNNESEITNQTEQGNEPPPITALPTSDSTSQSVGSLKSTRKIQLD